MLASFLHVGLSQASSSQEHCRDISFPSGIVDKPCLDLLAAFSSVSQASSTCFGKLENLLFEIAVLWPFLNYCNPAYFPLRVIFSMSEKFWFSTYKFSGCATDTRYPTVAVKVYKTFGRD